MSAVRDRTEQSAHRENVEIIEITQTVQATIVQTVRRVREEIIAEVTVRATIVQTVHRAREEIIAEATVQDITGITIPVIVQTITIGIIITTAHRGIVRITDKATVQATTVHRVDARIIAVDRGTEEIWDVR